MSSNRCASSAACTFRAGGRVELDADPLAPERLVELGERPRERTLRVAPGDGEEGAGGGGEGDSLGRGEAPRPGECGAGPDRDRACRSRRSPSAGRACRAGPRSTRPSRARSPAPRGRGRSAPPPRRWTPRRTWASQARIASSRRSRPAVSVGLLTGSAVPLDRGDHRFEPRLDRMPGSPADEGPPRGRAGRAPRRRARPGR